VSRGEGIKTKGLIVLGKRTFLLVLHHGAGATVVGRKKEQNNASIEKGLP